MYVYVYMRVFYVCVYVHTQFCINTFMRTCMCTSACVCMYICTHMYTYAYERGCVCMRAYDVYMYVCIYVLMHAGVHTDVPISIYTDTSGSCTGTGLVQGKV